jgi:hypothetical protein
MWRVLVADARGNMSPTWPVGMVEHAACALAPVLNCGEFERRRVCKFWVWISPSFERSALWLVLLAGARATPLHIILCLLGPQHTHRVVQLDLEQDLVYHMLALRWRLEPSG